MSSGRNSDVEQKALAVVDSYVAALNARDSEAIRDAFNFPHTRVGARGNLSYWERPEDYSFDHFFAKTGPDGWDHTEWDRTEVVLRNRGQGPRCRRLQPLSVRRLAHRALFFALYRHLQRRPLGHSDRFRKRHLTAGPPQPRGDFHPCPIP